MRIALAQLNPTVGDVAGNAALVFDAIEHAHSENADVLVTSELVLIGYPPRDLLLRQGVVDACEEAVKLIAKRAGDLHVIVGHPRKDPRPSAGGTRPFRNSASICHAGRVIAVADKQLLPGYDVFDEDRYFEPGERTCIVEINRQRIAVLICEDLWQAEDVGIARRYARQPIEELKKAKCDLALSLNASPFVSGKWHKHVSQMASAARAINAPLIAVNQIGANDDLIFDGRSVAVNVNGAPICVSPGFESNVTLCEAHGLQSMGFADEARRQVEHWREPQRELFHALVLGIRDYCRKTGHSQVFLGLSGGIDSALTAVLAVAALGPQHVTGVMMPSRYSSQGSIDDSLELAKRVRLETPVEIPIKQVHAAMQQTLEPPLAACASQGVTDENVQARLRGVILMAMANARGGLVLATSNKSEIATGYSTLYGDLCGAIAPLGDLTKTRIYTLANWMNQHHRELGFTLPPIPERSLSKPPSAELRPNQIDQDTLPPYELLDQIIERFMEREQSEDAIIRETGFDATLVQRTMKMIDRAQYKRDQAPVILKTTYRAFGRGRPMPIVLQQSLGVRSGELETELQGKSNGGARDVDELSDVVEEIKNAQ